ncbi:MAG: Gfo/Idh/MocA family protein [Defluviitoga tunisiensis]|jgi:predicted dehydrogenase|nr:Gfo/Idh/MocA family oxidoreductase [Defluviitoga tunisiensis]
MINKSDVLKNNLKLTYGMVGGGIGSFIGEVHRTAIRMLGNIDLVGGSFSRNYDNSLKTGESLGLQKERIYKDYIEMAEKEGKREDKIDFVSIVTPNNLHYPVAKKFLENGINVICEKPLVFEPSEAEELTRIAKANDLILAVTYTYSGYPMVKEAREMVRNGSIGNIRFIHGEYTQDWLASRVEEVNKQASWRVDPNYAGKSNVVGDIGSHIENVVSYISGLEITSLCANLDTFVDGRKLDDNAVILLNFNNGAKGIYWCSQIAIGHDNDLKIRIYGDKGSLEWRQEEPNQLRFTKLGESTQIISRGRTELHPNVKPFSKLPSGHPEGYFEAMSNIYSSIYNAIVAKKQGIDFSQSEFDFPKGEDGLKGVTFINKCVESSLNSGAWVNL